jgi:hypothetical protein
MQCITWRPKILWFIYNYRLYPLSHFQLFLTCCFCKYFSVTHFYYSFRYITFRLIGFLLLTDVGQVTDLFFREEKSSETPFIPIPLGGLFHFSANGTLDDALSYFPGVKVGTIYLYYLLLPFGLCLGVGTE